MIAGYAYFILARNVFGILAALYIGNDEGLGKEIAIALFTIPLIGRVLGWW